MSLRAVGHPLSWSLLITKQIQHLLSDVVTIFPVDVSSDPDKAASYHWSLWLLCWFLWLLPSAIYKNNIKKKKTERKLSGKNDPQAMKSLEIEVFLIMYHIKYNSPTDNEYYILLYK